MNLIPDFGMPSVVVELYRIWYEIHTSVFAVLFKNTTKAS